ncbi:MAG: hypothetical protein AB1898_32605 [Acidobacteriota bacterium]
MTPSNDRRGILHEERSGGLTVECKIQFEKGHRGRKIIWKRKSEPVYEQPKWKVPRVSRLMARAIEMDDLVRSGEVRDYD